MPGHYRGIEVFGPAPQPGTTGPRKAPSNPKQQQKSRRRRRPRTRRVERTRHSSEIGIAAAVAGGMTVLSTSVGIGSAMFRGYEVGALLAYVATGASVIAVLGGLLAVVGGRGRGWGFVAIVLGVLASPPVLTRVLRVASGLG